MGNNNTNSIANANTNNIANDNTNESDINKTFIWIDQNVNNKENLGYINDFFIKENRIIIRLTDVKSGIKTLLTFGYEDATIIISGRLFVEFYYEIKKKLKYIKASLTIIVFLSKKKEFIDNLKLNNIYFNNEILDRKYITSNPNKLKKYIDNNIKKKDLTFESVQNYAQLIIPNYYSYLLEDTSIAEIHFFNNYLVDHYSPNEKNKVFINKIKILKDKHLPKEIVIKYWLNAYCAEGDFYKELNRDLRISKNNIWIYYPFIKLCYEGIRKNFLSPSRKKLYRGSKISLSEYAKLKILLSKKVKNFPKVLLYSKSFLSFSENIDKAKKFLNGSPQPETLKVLYIIESIENNNNYDKITLSNAQLKKFSDFNEEEVLLFPLSCFELDKIEGNNGEEYLIIHLKYLGAYGNIIMEQLGENFMEKIEPTNFSQDLLVNGIVKNNYTALWLLKEKINLKIDKIFFFMKNGELLVTSLKTLILIFSINEFDKEKIRINVHDDEVLNVIHLENNQICSTSKDKTIKIISIINQKQFGVLKIIELEKNYAKQIFLFNKNKLVFIMNNNCVEYYNYKENEYLYKEKIIKEYGKIIDLKELTSDKIVYLSENKEKYKFLVFLSSKKEPNCITLGKDNLAGNHNMIIFENHIFIFFEEYIYIYNHMEPQKVKKSKMEFFSKATNIINISSNKILILFNSKEKKNELIIREYFLHLGFDENIKFDCIGEGVIQNEKVKQIIKIDDHQIFLKVKNESFLIIEKISEISQLFNHNYIKYNSYNYEMDTDTSNINSISILDGNLNEINTNSNNNTINLEIKQEEEINTDINIIIETKENSINENLIEEKSDKSEELKICNQFQFEIEIKEKEPLQICKLFEFKIKKKEKEKEPLRICQQFEFKIEKKEKQQLQICKQFEFKIEKKEKQQLKIFSNNIKICNKEVQITLKNKEKNANDIIKDIKNKIELLQNLLETKKVDENDLQNFSLLINPIKTLFDTKKEVENEIQAEELNKTLPCANKDEIKKEKGESKILKKSTTHSKLENSFFN